MRMLRHNRLFQAAVVAAGIVAFGASDALAWGHKKAGYGSYGASSGGYASSSSYGSYGSGSSSSYGSYGSSSSGSSADYGSSSAGSSGGRQGLFARWHAKKALKHANSGSSASYGSYASSSGSSASYGSYSGSSSSGSSASYGGYAAPNGYYDQDVPAYTDGVEGAVPLDAQPEAPLDPAASIRVTLPADALVFVNDRPTTSTGAERTFVSRGLAGGRTYAYQLRVEFTLDGEKVVENKVVRLQAGQSIDLSFGSGEQVASEGPASTDLTLHVPAEATVTLAGAPTKQTGELRTYATSALAPGQEWDGYVVRVELQRDGKTLVEEKTISIVGGGAYELSFDFAGNDAQVASIN